MYDTITLEDFMKQLLLVDANSMVFRAYYATAYGRMMSTSNGQPTNALFGFASMVFKALAMIKPEAVLFAFDAKAKTFRHKQYEAYKGTRVELPQELIDQFLIIRDYLDEFDVKRIEVEGYEADDIIGTMVKNYPDAKKIILTSDRDLLQLIDENTSVLLMKKGITETQLVDLKTLQQEQGLKPYQIIELKSLMGDSSDNIPGVTGIGEKTAKKLLDQYETLDGVYSHLHELKGKLRENLESQKELAYLSHQLATIYKNVPLDITNEQLVYTPNWQAAAKFFRTYEINSLVEFIAEFETSDHQEATANWVDFDQSFDKDNCFIMAGEFENDQGIKSASCFIVAHGDKISKIATNNISSAFKTWAKSKYKKIAFDAKSLYHLAKQHDFQFNGIEDDIWLMVFLDNTSLTSLDKIKDEWQISIDKKDMLQSDSMFAVEALKNYSQLKQTLQDKSLYRLYRDIEFKLIDPLFEMEKNGVLVNHTILQEINKKTAEKLKILEERIYHYTSGKFNINSPKQLAEVLYDQLGLPAAKKRSTAIDVLESLHDSHPIIPEIIEYRKYQKFYSTYTIGLQKFIRDDSRIHTDFNQCATQTGRLSSNHPNMQNISIKNEETAIIRKIFVAEKDSVILAADYSQIELRLLAHLANEQAMIDAFNQNIDIHTKTAMDIFEVGFDEVTSAMRRQAKAVNFGIIYGMSDFGLANQLSITKKQANAFMEAYNKSYPNIAKYMHDVVEFAKEHGYVKTIFDRRRVIDELFDSAFLVREFGKRAAMNAPIQGSAADLIKLAMLEVYNQLKDNDMQSTLILQVHDELVLNVKKDELPWVKTMVSKAMENVIDLKVPLQVSLNYGDNWYQAK